MKIAVVAAPRREGGASRATKTLIDAISDAAKNSSQPIEVVWLPENPWKPEGGTESNTGSQSSQKLKPRFFVRIARLSLKFLSKIFPNHPYIRGTKDTGSFALRSTGLAQVINDSDIDIVHLNWLGEGTISIKEIGQIEKPVIWTMHDMWTVCGAEHVCYDDSFLDGYLKALSKTPSIHLLINRFLWSRKKKHWKNSITLVAASSWLTDLARRSELTRSWPVHQIPLPIDTRFWSPGPRGASREKLGLPLRGKIILFGAMDGLDSYNKGGHLLLTALAEICAAKSEQEYDAEITLVTCGRVTSLPKQLPFNIRQLGVLDDYGMRDAYRASDLVVIASKIETFNLVAAEAQACGIPVITPPGSGVSDTVAHGVTGHVMTQLSANALYDSISALLAIDAFSEKRMAEASRTRAVALWTPETVAQEYLRVIEAAGDRGNSRLM